MVGGSAEAKLTLSEARAIGAETDPMLRIPESRALPTVKGQSGETTIERISDLSLRKAPASLKRLSAKGSAVYGYLGYADRYRFIPAMTELDGHAFAPIWNDPRYPTDNAIMTTGWLEGDKVCGLATFSFMGMTLATYNVVCDLATGRTIEFAELPDGTPIFSVAALAKDTNTLYGVVRRDKKYFFCSAPAENPMQLTDICETDDNMHLISLTYRDDDQTLYGVNNSGEFMKVGRDGKAEILSLLSTPKEVAGYITGLVYVPADREFIWNVNFSDYTAAVYRIDPVSYELTLIDECPENEQYSFFVCPDGAYDGQAPCRPALAEISFPEGGLSGSVSFTLPTEYQDGTPISGDLSYTILYDNEAYTDGSAAPGATVTATFKNLEQGFHSFGIMASSGSHQAPMQLASAYIGQDIPLPPTGVTLTESLLSWDPVTQGVNGGYVDVENMQYHIYFEGDEIAQTSATSFIPDLPTDRPISAMDMSVMAEYDNNFSQEAYSNYIVLGQPLEIPVDITPTLDQRLTCTADDANGSDNLWSFDSGDKSFKIFSNGKDADAWIFLPYINFPETDRYYTLTFDSRSLNRDIDGELLGVYIGKEDNPSAMTELGETFTPALSGYTPYERLVKVDETGTYYIGFRYTSPAGKYGLAVRNITLEDGGVSPDSPARPSGISATPGVQGELKARVDFTFPTLDVSGNPLPADTRIRAVIAGDNKVVANGKPGDRSYATVNTHQGDNRLSITLSIGEKNSPVGYVNVYTGVVKPLGVTNMGYLPLDNMMGVTVAWTEVTKGVDGGYVDPNDITYRVLRMEQTSFTTTWKPVIEGLTDTMYTYEMEADEPQQLLRIGVVAVNAAGESDDMAVASLVAGTPYTLPMEDNFAEAGDEGAKYAPYINYRIDSSYTSSFIFVTPEELGSEFADEEGFYFAASGQDGAKARLGLPCFATTDCGAEFSLTALCGNGFAPISVWVDCADFRAPIQVGTMPSEGGLVTKTFRLPESTDRKQWVQVLVDGTITNGDMLAMRGFSVKPVAAGVAATAEDNLKAVGGKGQLDIYAPAGARLEVFTAAGALAARLEKASGHDTVLLPAGVYLVKCGENTLKIFVK